MDELFYNIREAATFLQCSESSVRRKIKTGKLKAELVSGQYGLEYRVPISSLAPSTSIVDVVKVESVLSLDDLREVMQGVMGERDRVLVAKMDEQSEKMLEMQEELAEMRKLMENKKESWWRNLFGKGG